MRIFLKVNFKSLYKYKLNNLMQFFVAKKFWSFFFFLRSFFFIKKRLFFYNKIVLKKSFLKKKKNFLKHTLKQNKHS
jgi:hypothetical protein